MGRTSFAVNIITSSIYLREEFSLRFLFYFTTVGLGVIRNKDVSLYDCEVDVYVCVCVCVVVGKRNDSLVNGPVHLTKLLI